MERLPLPEPGFLPSMMAFSPGTTRTTIGSLAAAREFGYINPLIKAFMHPNGITSLYLGGMTKSSL
jgi:hypothetical protein